MGIDLGYLIRHYKDGINFAGSRFRLPITWRILNMRMAEEINKEYQELARVVGQYTFQRLELMDQAHIIGERVKAIDIEVGKIRIRKAELHKEMNALPEEITEVEKLDATVESAAG